MATDKQAPYSASRRAGDLVFISGQLGRDEHGHYSVGTRAQTRTALLNLERVLDQAGGGLGDVVKVQLFLADINDWEVATDEYLRFFDDPLPARSAFGVGLPAGALVEVEAVAWLPGSGAGDG